MIRRPPIQQGSGRPAGFPWNYGSEIIVDGVIHALGICSGLIGAVIIIVIASHSTKIVTITSVLIYAAGLVAMLGFSAAYNMWPVSPTKWVLRRFDHSAIYLLIAGTYTPFIAQLKISFASGGLLTGVWLTAGFGVVLKLVLPGRFDRVAVVLYLLLGWSGVRFRHCLASKLNSLASRGRRCAVSDGCHLSSLAEPAFSERDLALRMSVLARP
jgi:hemolysin III